ncbi:MAG: DUF4160 domain-containing protein [Peptococcaceae bacterium]|nr:DUF4160 domain-containing protein [Peptococcaceae bacterium]
MPTVFIEKGFRFFFYSKDISERPHIHIENADGEIKLWLDTFTVAKRYSNMKKGDERQAIEIAKQRYQDIIDAWQKLISTGGVF